MKYMKYVLFTSVMAIAAILISQPTDFAYGWHTFLPYHIVTGMISFALLTVHMGRNDHEKYNMFTKSWRKSAIWATVVALIMGPFGILAIIGAMLQHRFTYGKFVWR